MTPRLLPDQKYLKECFRYSRRTGVLTWRVRPLRHFRNRQAWAAFNNRYAGHEAGYVMHNPRKNYFYRAIGLGGKHYFATRIIYKMVTDLEPVEIDHRDRNSLHNAWRNLRAADGSENKCNILQRAGRSGYRGVTVLNGKFRARIKKNGRLIHIGTYVYPKQAHEAYVKMAKLLHGEFAVTGTRAAPEARP